MEAQAIAEQKLEQDTESRTQYRVEFECSPPQPCSEFQTARLILSHLGFLSLPALRSHAVDSPVPRLVALDNTEPAFAAELAALDRLPPRTHDTLLAFYVRAGQSAAESIVANSNAADLSPLYLELLAALGWPVQVDAIFHFISFIFSAGCNSSRMDRRPRNIMGSESRSCWSSESKQSWSSSV